MAPDRSEPDADEPISDEELEQLALAAPSEVVLNEHAVAWSPTHRDPLIADWYMAAPVGTRRDLRTRIVVAAIVASIVLINAAGLCVTYGRVILG